MQPASRPHMKTAAPLLRGAGLLHIVGSGSVHTIADPEGAIHRLVELADGSRSIEELFCALHAGYPQIQEPEVVDAVRELEAAGVFASATTGWRHRSELAAPFA